jgi:hypothetical protein
MNSSTKYNSASQPCCFIFDVMGWRLILYKMEQEQKVQLIQDFATAINKVSAENGSNTPDFILANYLIMCLENFDHIVKMRDDWYGVHLAPADKHFIDV